MFIFLYQTLIRMYNIILQHRMCRGGAHCRFKFQLITTTSTALILRKKNMCYESTNPVGLAIFTELFKIYDEVNSAAVFIISILGCKSYRIFYAWLYVYYLDNDTYALYQFRRKNVNTWLWWIVTICQHFNLRKETFIKKIFSWLL